MKKFLIFFIATFVFGGEYYAKLEPLHSYTFCSKVAGLVSFVNYEAEGKIAGNEPIVKIDDEVARLDYEVAKQTYSIKEDIYEKTSKISTKSKVEKDTQKINYLSAKQAFIKAKDNYFSRTIKAKDLYIGDILVEKNSFVNHGTPLFKAFDYSMAKITIFVSKDDIKAIENKKILVNGKSDFKLHKFFSVADTTYISSYKVELIGPTPKLFSELVKVEIK